MTTIIQQAQNSLSGTTQQELDKKAKHFIYLLQDKNDMDSEINFKVITNDISRIAAESPEEAGVLTQKFIEHLEFRIQDDTLNSPIAEFQEVPDGHISQNAIDLIIKSILQDEYFPLTQDVQMKFNAILIDLSENYLKTEPA